jgi:cytochrome P450
MKNRTERRGDFIDRLKEMSEDLKKQSGKNESLLSEEIIVAQGIAFFVAGFETSSNTLSTLAVNLAKNPQVQVPFTFMREGGLGD